jgi:hypothetical protein
MAHPPMQMQISVYRSEIIRAEAGPCASMAPGPGQRLDDMC